MHVLVCSGLVYVSNITKESGVLYCCFFMFSRPTVCMFRFILFRWKYYFFVSFSFDIDMQFYFRSYVTLWKNCFCLGKWIYCEKNAVRRKCLFNSEKLIEIYFVVFHLKIQIFDWKPTSDNFKNWKRQHQNGKNLLIDIYVSLCFKVNLFSIFFIFWG